MGEYEYLNDSLTLCHQFDPKMIDKDVVDELRDGQYADMHYKVIMLRQQSRLMFTLIWPWLKVR